MRKNEYAAGVTLKMVLTCWRIFLMPLRCLSFNSPHRDRVASSAKLMKKQIPAHVWSTNENRRWLNTKCIVDSLLLLLNIYYTEMFLYWKVIPTSTSLDTYSRLWFLSLVITLVASTNESIYYFESKFIAFLRLLYSELSEQRNVFIPNNANEFYNDGIKSA